MISFIFDWLDLLAVQWTMTSHPRQSMLVFSHLYMSTGMNKNVILWTSIGQVMSSLFNMLLGSFSSRKQLSSNFIAVITNCSEFRASKEEICHCFYIFPFYMSWSNGTICDDLTFCNIENSVWYLVLFIKCFPINIDN